MDAALIILILKTAVIAVTVLLLASRPVDGPFMQGGERIIPA